MKPDAKLGRGDIFLIERHPDISVLYLFTHIVCINALCIVRSVQGMWLTRYLA